MKMGQLLKQNRAVHDNLQNSPAHSADAGVTGSRSTDNRLPSFLQLHPLVAATPASRRKQPTQDFSQLFGVRGNRGGP